MPFPISRALKKEPLKVEIGRWIHMRGNDCSESEPSDDGVGETLPFQDVTLAPRDMH
jgi:hypothetical protein